MDKIMMRKILVATSIHRSRPRSRTLKQKVGGTGRNSEIEVTAKITKERKEQVVTSIPLS